jgi:P-type conjugative transfer protein TrbJ
MVKNLEHFDELTFQNLVALAYAVNDIIQYGYSLGHTLYDLDEQFAETFPGYEPILQSDWLATFEYRNRRTLDTLRYTLGALKRISDDSVEAHDILSRIAGDADAADGNLEALQAANEFLNVQGSQLAKISQQLSVQTNAQAVFWAYEVDREASDRATTSEWIANGVGEVPPYEGAAGARAVPAGWPWPCLNCGQRAAGDGR